MIKRKLDLNPKNSLEPAKGRLLVAEPFMNDPYFKRSVVLLCEHNSEGSMGYVLNRPVNLKINELVAGLPDLNAQISLGGPVGSGELFYIHRFGNRIDGSLRVTEEFYTGGEFEQIKDILRVDPSQIKQMRFFVGYSGWSEGQLKTELEANSWLIAPSSPSLLMEQNSDLVWKNTLTSMGGKFAPLANFPEDPSMN